MSINALLNGVIGLVLIGFLTSFREIKLKEELNRKNYEMELQLIKSQIDPHFLFNTLNNIDVLIEKDASKASAYLNKLSDIIRFMLYETKTDRIPLAEELNYIDKYIELCRIRTSNPDYISYSVMGDHPAHLSIAPLVFIPFIENAVKHSESRKGENAVNVNFIIESDKIDFICENKYNHRKSNNAGHGMGNDLIKKRIALLYPERHELKISDNNGEYKVKLSIRHEH